MRVFKELILSNLIEPKFTKKELDIFDYSSLKSFAQDIINSSIDFNCPYSDVNLQINKAIYDYENELFILSDNTKILLDNEINYAPFLSVIDEDTAPLNLLWLKYILNGKNARNKHAFKFPIEKVVIVEGITEEILLPVFAHKLGYDFNKNGIHVISAGGKNQVVKMFYNYAEQLKIPIFVLLDSDAESNYIQICDKMRKFDKIHIIKSGEFEDILPKTLIKKTLNDYLKNLNYVDENDFEYDRMVENLEEIFKNKGFHEFKKAEFAQLVKTHIEDFSDISEELVSIAREIKEVPSCVLQ